MSRKQEEDSAAILIDTTLCTGCEECVAACKKEHSLGADLPRPWKQRIDDLSPTRYCTILRRPGERSIRQQCRHCTEPACVSVCLVGAMQKTPEGPVIYDSNKCMGCRYCLMACPYGIPRYDWDKTVPFVQKCSLCYDRLKQGGQPVCVEACPEKATIFGKRSELLAEAHRRIERAPGRYYNHVFGETEFGGTSVLYLSDISLDFLTYDSSYGDTPLPELTWKAISKVPPVMVGMSALMTGVYWVIGRRMKLAAGNITEEESPIENLQPVSGESLDTN